MSKNKNIPEKKKWKFGRNPLSTLIVIGALIIIFLAIYIPTSITKAYTTGAADALHNYSSISYIKNTDIVPTKTETVTTKNSSGEETESEETSIDYDSIESYDAADFTAFNLTLTATDYNDRCDDVYNADVNFEEDDDDDDDSTVTQETDSITVSVSITQNENNPVTFGNVETGSSYVMYIGLSVASNWVGDNGYYSSAVRIKPSEITSGTEKTGYEIKCECSYPAKRTVCWPFTKTIDSPDIYAFIYYRDNANRPHRYLVKYTYKEYMTSDTNGAIVKA